MKKLSFKLLFNCSLFLALILAGCNIFNPSGEGDTPESSAGKLSVGQTLLQGGDYEGAMKAFEDAYKKNPKNSLARYSYAKAVRLHYGFNGLKLSEELTGIDENTSTVPFITTETSVMNQYYQTTWRVKPVLQELVIRDSLTRIWNYKFESELTSKEQAQLDWLMNSYFTETSDRYSQSDFPLSDGVINYEKVTPDLALILLVHVFADLKDFNEDKVIDENDDVNLVNSVLDILNNENASLDDLSDLINDDESAAGVNAIIDKFSAGTEDISNVVDLISQVAPGAAGNGEDDEASEEMTAEISQAIEEMGSTIIFFKYNDGIDNDGDGCVDEEAIDGIDNDGDGYIDEDSNSKNIYLALDPAKPVTPRTLPNLIDPSDSSGTELEISEPDLLAGDEGGVLNLGTDFFVSQPDEATQDNLRFQVLDMIANSNDTIPPYNLSSTDLNFAITNVGGCWKNY